MVKKSRNMSFAAIFISVCRGVRDFPRLMNLSPVRVVLHLFFLAFLMALFITFSRSFAVFRSIDLLCSEIEQQCGDFIIDEHGLRPSIAPDKEKLLYSANCSFRYYPNNDFNLTAIEQDITNFGVIWNPGIMVLWMRLPDNKYSVIPLIYPKFNEAWNVSDVASRVNEMSSLTVPELADYIKTKGNVAGPFNVRFTRQSVMVLKQAIKFYAAAVIFFAFLGNIFFQALLFTVIYAIIFSLVGGGKIKTLKMKQIFAVGTYCTFPAIFIASFFPALRLPLDYQTVFLFAFLIYLVVVFNYLQRFLLVAGVIEEQLK